MKRALILALATLSLAGTSTPAFAQRGMRGQDRAQLERRVRERFAEMVRQQLGLDAEQADALGEVVRSFDTDRQELAREDRAIRSRVQALVLEGGDSDGEAAELLERMRALRFEEAEIFQREQDALLQVLSPVQLLHFLTMRDQLGQRIRQLRGNGPPGGVPRPRGGNDPTPVGLGGSSPWFGG